MDILFAALGLFFVTIALFVFADRFAGGGFYWDKLSHDAGGPLRGRPVAYAFVISAIGLWLITKDWHAATLALGFAVWRWPGWKINGRGGIDPTNVTDAFYLFVRHLLVLVIVIPAHYLLGHDWDFGLFAPPILFAVAGTWLGVLNGAKTLDNGPVEMIRGGFFGAMVGSLLLL